MDIRERLSEITKTAYLKSASNMTDLACFYEVYDETLRNYGQKMQEFSPQLLDTLLSVLAFLDAAAQDTIKCSGDHIHRLVCAIDNLAASFPEPATGKQSFARFLWTLHNGDELFSESNVLQNYDKYIDLLENMSWLFQLEIDSCLIYPISNLLTDKILREFDPSSEEDLLYLIASLQLFNQLRCLPRDRRDTVLALSKEYNLKILEMLCDHGQLLFGNSRKDNLAKNKIMGVRCENKVLIRTTDLSREAPPEICFEYETNRDSIPIAKFFIYELNPDDEFCSLDEFFRNSSPEQCMAVFLNCLENRVYNVFMEGSMIYNGNNRTFVRWVNPLVSDDPVIVSNSSFHKADSGESSFFAHLDERTRYWFRPTVLVKSGIDRLTLDYMIGFYTTVCKPLNISARTILCEETSVWKQEFAQRKDQFAQNLMTKSFFTHVLNHNLDVPKAIMSYAEFISKNYSSYGEITNETRLIFPYSYYRPFENETELLTAILKGKGEIVTDCRMVTLTCRMPHGWQIIELPGEFTYLDISTLEEIPLKPSLAHFSGLLDETNKKVYILYNPVDKSIITAFNRLKDHSESPVITEQNCGAYKNFLLSKPLEKLMYDIEIPGDLKKLFWPGADADKLSLNQLSPLLLFKIIHHINHYRITPEKLADWGKLIFDCHLVAPSSISEQMYDLFRNGVNARNKDGTCLMISKRSYADKSTLGAILNNAKERFATDSAFDACAINHRIEFNDETQQYHFTENKKSHREWKERIESIVFLTDNIMSGKSTYEMLGYHFRGQPLSSSSNYYMTLDPEKTVLKIMQKNNPRIELHTVFWFTSLCGCTVYSEDKDGFYPVDYPISQTETIRFYVKAYQSYQPEKYLYTQGAFELAKGIYGEKNIPAHRAEEERRHLVFRFNNMPAFSVFPKDAQTILNKAGLFERR